MTLPALHVIGGQEDAVALSRAAAERAHEEARRAIFQALSDMDALAGRLQGIGALAMCPPGVAQAFEKLARAIDWHGGVAAAVAERMEERP